MVHAKGQSDLCWPEEVQTPSRPISPEVVKPISALQPHWPPQAVVLRPVLYQDLHCLSFRSQLKSHVLREASPYHPDPMDVFLQSTYCKQLILSFVSLLYWASRAEHQRAGPDRSSLQVAPSPVSPVVQGKGSKGNVMEAWGLPGPRPSVGRREPMPACRGALGSLPRRAGLLRFGPDGRCSHGAVLPRFQCWF